jgi:hypothetical protein
MNNIKVLGIMFRFVSYSSCFLQYALHEDVCHLKALLKLGDVQVAYGILFSCFA